MPIQSEAERKFKTEYPGAHVGVEFTVNGRPASFLVRVGGYPCATGRTRAQAYQNSLQDVESGVCTPSPYEGVEGCLCNDEDCPACSKSVRD
jgi:hypothetical protein